MAKTFVSSLNAADGSESIVPGASPVPVDPFLPNSANLFPKLVERINDAAWELWQFDGLSSDGETAVTISFYRDTRGLQDGGFHAELNALWPDGSKWGEKLYFTESVITAEGEAAHNGSLRGVWQSQSQSQSQSHSQSPGEGGSTRSKTNSVSFDIAADLATARVTFSVPDRVEGTLELRALSRAPLGSRLAATEEAAKLGPSVYYLFPLGPAAVAADLVFSLADETEDEAAAAATSLETNGAVNGDHKKDKKKTLILRPEDGARGGFVRGWSALAWPQIMTDAYYVCGTAGPYMLQVIRIESSAADGRKPHVVARLYRDGELVCAANQLGERHAQSQTENGGHGHNRDEDVVVVDKLLDGGEEGWLAGAFRDRNTGYAIEFIQGTKREGHQQQQQRKRWRFQARHRRPWWSDYTSDKGTGKSGFLETILGGSDEEASFKGSAGAGQLQLP
ncbi:hypothetical protein L228DRAFT_238399 [Xylona heveae TC161]|uniref:Uncharacterized protein n=1 Tax=Xylona heveae (strain CBS 132557 / TC161) TaxID=1328760 RepID=A0A165HSR8_XYLHT|nr:hypothetical protein L228DRAFT_238399 [Xylona heveae TC161]KZF23888.1 hypothetical protein L228DRAFT_238399 [Xylona heveae TC161]